MIDLGIFASLGPWYKFWKPESGMIGEPYIRLVHYNHHRSSGRFISLGTLALTSNLIV